MYSLVEAQSIPSPGKIIIQFQTRQSNALWATSMCLWLISHQNLQLYILLIPLKLVSQ